MFGKGIRAATYLGGGRDQRQGPGGCGRGTAAAGWPRFVSYAPLSILWRLLYFVTDNYSFPEWILWVFLYFKRLLRLNGTEGG